MIIVSLERLESGDQGTFGQLQVEIDGVIYSFYSVELPWRDNHSDLSCIPTGTYPCRWTESAKFKRYLYEVDGVPNRSGIRIHSANLAGDTTKGYKSQLLGCIAPGEQLGSLDGQRAVIGSSSALKRFEALLNKEPFNLEIK